MFQALFSIILNLVATLIQIIMAPVNAIIVNAFPDFSATVTTTTNSLVGMFDGMGWATGLIPNSVKVVLISIVGMEISKHSVYVMSHAIVKVWNLIQKLKFW